MKLPAYNCTDIPMFITKNMFTKDINLVKSSMAISLCVKNLILTILGERGFNTLIGTNIHANVFADVSVSNRYDQRLISLENDIVTCLMNYEPRITDITVKSQFLDKILNFTITYKNIKTSEIQTLNIAI